MFNRNYLPLCNKRALATCTFHDSKLMKKTSIPITLFFVFACLYGFRRGEAPSDLVTIQGSMQRDGDATKGYEYLTTGDFLKSGLPYDIVIKAAGKNTTNLLHRTGKNATVDYGFNVIGNDDSIDIVIPTCLQCHAEVLDGQLVIGLGNASADFSHISQQSKKLQLLKMLQFAEPKKYLAAKAFLNSVLTVDPEIETEVRGVNPADQLAAALVAHRDPQTLVWSNRALLDVPEKVIPTDVPAWWLLKKKNAMFYTGFGRGDFSRFLMMSNLLTVKDTAEAEEVYSHFGDVLAYIKTLEVPKYPKNIDTGLAATGEILFNDHCSRCHGTYGPYGQYPNVLVPGNIINTDSFLYLSNQQNPQFINWFLKSWFASGDHPARLEPFNGYVAPPLDGVWVTAPYFHNGSVPTIEGVLNSAKRPKYWTRNFNHPQYDYEHLGWVYTTSESAEGKKYYNTTLPGYGNYGHYFGDKLTDDERLAVIEYLKGL